MNAFYVLFDVCRCDFLVCFDVYGVFVVGECCLLPKTGVVCFVSG